MRVSEDRLYDLSPEAVANGVNAAISHAFSEANEWKHVRNYLHEWLGRVYRVRILNDSYRAVVQDRAPDNVGNMLYSGRDFTDALRWVMENRKPNV